MPTFRHGKLTYFGLGTSNAEATETNLSNYLTDVQFPRPVDVAETSTFGQAGGSKTYVVGYSSAQFSFTGRYDETIDGYLSALLGSEKPVGFGYGPGGAQAARRKYLGICYVTSYDVQGGVGDMVGISLQAQVTGGIGTTVFPSGSTSSVPTLTSTTLSTTINDLATLNGEAADDVVLASATGLSASGAVLIQTDSNGAAVISYTSISTSTLKNCTLLAGSGKATSGVAVKQ